MTKTRVKYEKPSMKVIYFKQQVRLLVGSGGLDDPNDYNNGGNPFGS